MKSIIDRFGEIENNFKTLNLVIVGLGDDSAVRELLAYLQKCFSIRIKEDSIKLYSESVLNMAESNPELLQKSTHISLGRARSFSREYIGFVDCDDYNKLYSYLYNSSMTSSKMRRLRPYYSQRGLSRIIHERFDTDDYDIMDTFGDVSIRATRTPLNDNGSYVRIEYQICELLGNDSITSYLEWFRTLILEMDLRHSECFRSAYISFNYPQMDIVHARVYDNFDIECLDEYILGAEWCVYLSNSIVKKLKDGAIDSIENLVSVCTLSNGIAYTANINVNSFGGEIRKKLSEAFEENLVPAFGVYGWSGLHVQSWNVSYLPQCVYVYFDAYERDDPTVVFAYNYQRNEIQEMKGLNDTDLMDAWVLQKNK